MLYKISFLLLLFLFFGCAEQSSTLKPKQSKSEAMLERMHARSARVGKKEDGRLTEISTRKSRYIDKTTQTAFESPEKVSIAKVDDVVVSDNDLLWENSLIVYLSVNEYDLALQEFIELKYPQKVQEYNLAKKIEREKQIEAQEQIKKRKAKEAKQRAQRKREAEAKAKVQEQKLIEEKKQADKLEKEKVVTSFKVEPKVKEVEKPKEKVVVVKKNIKQKKYKRTGEFIVSSSELMWQDTEDTKRVNTTFTGAKEFCDNLTLEGYDDWRLPSKQELSWIVDINRKPTINKEFVNVRESSYWSISDYKNSKYYAWVLYFDSGNSGSYSKNKRSFVRCVRDGE